MKCFSFLSGDKRDHSRTPKAQSSMSISADGEVKGNESDLNSQDVSETSTGSSAGRANFPTILQRPSNLREFTVSELRSATKNFGSSVMIGEGGFGCVFKGTIKSAEDSSNTLQVAVKKLDRRGMQGHREWLAEVNFLGVVEHPNLVKLLGYCADDDDRGIQRLLVYEYMPNGSVDNHLSPRSGAPLPWSMRLRIARDTAQGLAYLHEGMDFQIIFRDFKSSNILLDEQWNAKLSDFGLARLGPTEGLTHVSTEVVGTAGYAAPEYVHTGRLTSRNDVWSYGVFLYELITGRRPMDRSLPKCEQNLLEWIKPYLSNANKFQLIVDSRLERKDILKSVYRLATVANRCLVQQPKLRPKMSEVLEAVSKILEESGVEGGCESPSKSFESAQNSGDSGTMNNKRTADFKSGCVGWCGRLWTAKVC